MKFFIILALLLCLQGCGLYDVLEPKKYDICEPIAPYGLVSSYRVSGRCNAVDNQCPSGFSKVKSDTKVANESCTETICGSPSEDGTGGQCVTNVLQ